MNWCCGPLLKQMCSHLLHSHSMIWRHPRWHMIQWLIMRSHSQIFAGNLLTFFSQASTIKGQHILLKCRDLHVEVLNLNYSESVLLPLQICTSANLYIDTSSSLHFWFSQYRNVTFLWAYKFYCQKVSPEVCIPRLDPETWLLSAKEILLLHKNANTRVWSADLLKCRFTEVQNLIHWSIDSQYQLPGKWGVMHRYLIETIQP